MTAQVTQSVSNGALTTPNALTPAASDTFARTQFGPTGIQIRVITTGTATDVTVTDPTTTGLSNAGTPPTLSCPATGVRLTFIPLAAINPATDNATVNFSGARTGVTYEATRA
jgi:hypothetical protein